MIDLNNDPNNLLPIRCTLFTEKGVIETLKAAYGSRPESLGLNICGHEIVSYRIRSLLKDQFVLAPFNFQPIARDHGIAIATRIIERAWAAGPQTSAILRLHHPLPEAFCAEHGLALSNDTVETLLSLRPSAQQTIDALPKKQRWELKKVRADSQREGIVVRRFSDPSTLERFYRIMLRAYRDKHRMLPQPSQLLQRLMAVQSRRRGCHGYVAERSSTGEVLGGIFVTRDETQWSYAWAANSPASAIEKLGLGTLLVGEAICDAAAEGAPLFSFGASPVSHEPLRRFKKKWGGVEHAVLTYHWRVRPAPIDLHRDFQFVRWALALTPLPIIRAVSPFAVRLLV